MGERCDSWASESSPVRVLSSFRKLRTKQKGPVYPEDADRPWLASSETPGLPGVVPMMLLTLHSRAGAREGN